MEIVLAVTSKAGASVVPKLAGAKVTSIKWTLNEPEAWTFEIDRHDPQAALIPTSPIDANEVQLWIDGELRGWGPVVRRDKNTVQCVGCRWYFAHRFLGPVYSFMSTYNGSFEATATGAFPTGWIQDFLSVAEVVDDFGVHGNKALHIEGSPGLDEGFAGLLFSVNKTYDLEVEVSAWWQNTSGFATFHDQGLVLVLFDSTNTIMQQVVYATFDITQGPEMNVWRRKSAKITIPATQHYLEIRLYAPAIPSGLAIYWDCVEVRLDQRTFSTEAEDASVLIRRLVDYCTGDGFGGGPSLTMTDFVLKSDLAIAWDAANTSSVGRIGARSYDHGTGASFESLLAEFPERGLCDMEVTYSSSALTRKWTIYAPAKGTDRTTMAFLYDENGAGNIIDYDGLWDGMQSASQVRVPGPGRAGSESGLATGTGTLVEVIMPPRNDSDLNAVDASADTALARRQEAQVPWIIVSGASALLAAGLTTGDTIHPQIRDGWVVVTDAFRVVAMEIPDPDVDVLRLILNVA